jgi:hypothetical protein
MIADSAARVTAASAGGGSLAIGHRGDPGDGRVPVPRHNRVSSPEAGIGLLAVGAGQSAEGVYAPAGIDRADADVGLAERCGIGVPGDARPQLTPHHRYPELIADHSPRGTCRAGGGLRAGSSLRAGRSFRPGSSFRAGSSLRPGSSLRAGSSLRPGRSLGKNFWPHIAALRRLRVAIVGRVGVAIIPEGGEPAVRLEPFAVLERAGVV